MMGRKGKRKNFFLSRKGKMQSVVWGGRLGNLLRMNEMLMHMFFF
jgi:hypothetical protein